MVHITPFELWASIFGSVISGGLFGYAVGYVYGRFNRDGTHSQQLQAR